MNGVQDSLANVSPERNGCRPRRCAGLCGYFKTLKWPYHDRHRPILLAKCRSYYSHAAAVPCRLRAVFSFPLSRSRTFAEAGPRKQQLLEFSNKINACNWVHSSVVRATNCRSAGPWFKSGCALFNTRPWCPTSQLRSGHTMLDIDQSCCHKLSSSCILVSVVSCRHRAVFPFPLSRSRTVAEAGQRKQQLLKSRKKKSAIWVHSFVF